MNPCPVSIDEARYQRELCDGDARQDLIDNARDELADAWRREYNRTGALTYLSGDNPRDYCEPGETLGAVLDRLALAAIKNGDTLCNLY